jgi:hypothetical protein
VRAYTVVAAGGATGQAPNLAAERRVAGNRRLPEETPFFRK